MKAIFPGTASGIATKTRFHNIILLESDGHTLLLDGGEPLSTLLIRRDTNWEMVDGMVITHLHPDHAAALPQLLQTFQISQRKNPFQVLLPSEGLSTYRDFLNMLYLFDLALPYRLDLLGISCDISQTIGSFSLDFSANLHLAGLSSLAKKQGLHNPGQSYSLSVTSENKRIVYSGDIRSALELKPLLQAAPTDLLILEMAHFAPEEFLHLMKTCPVRKIVLTHFHPRLDIAPDEQLRDIVAHHVEKVIFAEDGMEVEI